MPLRQAHRKGGMARRQIGVIGAESCSEEIYELAFRVGKEIARLGHVLICGGLGGVMEAACKGAKEAGGLTVGILPGPAKEAANRWVDVVIATDMGHARNVIIVHSSDGLIAVSGGPGTLSEIAIALKTSKPVVSLKSFTLDGLIPQASGPEEAVWMLLEMLEGK